ncbi:hypothetical protein ACFO0M_15480 [Micromonospora mangrovi]|uniref:Uncharacterized protein n=2 Tax=Micromonospora TaxID=1873 RepID=A0AAU8HGT6_9ACTN
MRRNPHHTGRRCEPAGGVGRVRARPTRRTPVPDHPSGCGPGEGTDPAYGGVRVRFTPSDVPVLTCFPADRAAALRGAAEALARLGRADLGGCVEVSPAGPPDPRSAAVEHLAAARAVENALRGGCGTVRLPPRWPRPTST